MFTGLGLEHEITIETKMSRGFRFPILTSRGHPTLMIQLFEWVVRPGIFELLFRPYDGSVETSWRSLRAFPVCAVTIPGAQENLCDII